MDLDNLNKICNILQKHWNCQKRLHDLAKTSWSFTGSSDRKMTIGYWSRWYQSYSLLRSYSILFIQKSPTVPAGNFLKFIPLPSTLSDGRGSRISHMKSTGDRFNIKKSCPTFCQQLCICFFPWINHIFPANVFSIHLHLSLPQYLFMAKTRFTLHCRTCKNKKTAGVRQVVFHFPPRFTVLERSWGKKTSSRHLFFMFHQLSSFSREIS